MAPRKGANTVGKMDRNKLPHKRPLKTKRPKKSVASATGQYTDAELKKYSIGKPKPVCNFCDRIFKKPSVLRLHVAGTCPQLPLSRVQMDTLARKCARNGLHPQNNRDDIIDFVKKNKRLNPRAFAQTSVDGTGMNPNLAEKVLLKTIGHDSVMQAPLAFLDMWHGRHEITRRKGKVYSRYPISYNVSFERLLRLHGIGKIANSDPAEYYWLKSRFKAPRPSTNADDFALQLAIDIHQRKVFEKQVAKRIRAGTVRRIIMFCCHWDRWEGWIMSQKTTCNINPGECVVDNDHNDHIDNNKKSNSTASNNDKKMWYEKPKKGRNHCSLMVIDIDYNNAEGPTYKWHWFESFVKDDRYYRYVMARNRLKAFTNFLNKFLPFQKAKLLTKPNLTTYPNVVPNGCVASALYFAIMAKLPDDKGNLRQLEDIGHPNHSRVIAGLMLFLREFYRQPRRAFKSSKILELLKFFKSL